MENNFRDNILAYVKLLIYKCSGMKNQLRAPIEEHLIYANPKFEEKSDFCDFLTLYFGKEIIELKIVYENRPKLVKRRNYDTDEIYELSIDGMIDYFVSEISLL